MNEEDEEMDEGEDEESDGESVEDETSAGPSQAKKAAKRKTADSEEDGIEGAEEDEEEGTAEVEEEEEEEEGRQEEEEGQLPVMSGPPRILLTTSPGATKATYQFCDELKNVFPGGEFFKRPKGSGFELGRVARWAAKRGFHACIVINEDHKKPSKWQLFSLELGN